MLQAITVRVLVTAAVVAIQHGSGQITFNVKKRP